MLAKKVFLIIVLSGASYLAYQTIAPLDLFTTSLVTDNTKAVSIESSLKKDVDELRKRVSLLAEQNSQLSATLENIVRQNTSKPKKKDSTNVVATASPIANKETVKAVDTALVDENVSLRQKRLNQQAQLRDLADKHQLGAVAALK